MPKNVYAVMLGKMAAGKSKKLTPEQIESRRAVLAENRKKRWVNNKKEGESE